MKKTHKLGKRNRYSRNTAKAKPKATKATAAAHNPQKASLEPAVAELPAVVTQPLPEHPAPDSARSDRKAADAAAQIAPVRLDSQRPWLAQHEAVVGLSHRNANPPMPCQDAATSVSLPHPVLIVADGAGSAALSEVGSEAVVRGLARLLNTLDKQIASLLDEPVNPTAMVEHDLRARNFALLLVKHAKGVLEDLAEQQRRSARDFRCTLLLIVAGQHSALWLKIGDGALVVERRSRLADERLHAELCTLGLPGKGEFANITQFIDDQLRPADVQSGLLDLQDISGLAAMSDGAAEKLIAQDGSKVARQLENWFEALRQGKLARRDLTRSFYSDAFCARSSGDDCSIALLASALRIETGLPAI